MPDLSNQAWLRQTRRTPTLSRQEGRTPYRLITAGRAAEMTTMVDTVNHGCHAGLMKKVDPSEHEATLNRLKEVRAQALEHTRIARQFSAERRQIMEGLLRDGFSQSDLARELGVTRQAIQKMLAV